MDSIIAIEGQLDYEQLDYEQLDYELYKSRDDFLTVGKKTNITTMTWNRVGGQ